MTRGRQIPPEQVGQGILAIAPIFIILFAILYAVWDSAYTVQPHERAVVFRFGKLQTTVEPGLHFKVPFVDEAVLVDVQEIERKLPFEFAPSGNIRGIDHEDESLMLTGDLNAAVVEWTIQWRVIDPARFLISIDQADVMEVIANASRAVMHQIIGDYSIDEVLTSKRTEVGDAARVSLQETLDMYESGIQITGLQMQRITPPALVKPAFDEVNASVQHRDQLINEANRERNVLIPKAQAEKDRLIQSAEGYAAGRRAEAEGEIAALLDQYKAYKESPEITRQRLYLEALEEIFAAGGPTTVIDADLKGLVPFLNVDQLAAPAMPRSAISDSVGGP